MTDSDQLKLLLKALKGLQDGHVTPEEARDLCVLISIALTSLRKYANSYISKVILDSASVILRDIGEEILRKHGSN